MYTRREFGKLTFAGLVPQAALVVGQGPAQPRIAYDVAGVPIGVQTYSFRGLPRPAGGDLVDALVRAMAECGLGECELWAPQIEPAQSLGRGASADERQGAREALRRWRLDTPLDHFRAIRGRFEQAGLRIYGYNLSFNDGFSDEEIDRGFETARALGAEIVTASSTLSAARRVAPFAASHRTIVAMHNHSNTSDPNEFATPDSLLAATTLSPWIRVNLDIGHFTAAGYDAVAFLREHHALVTNLHVKDRRSNQGDNVLWGTGDTPIRQVLALVKAERWPIHAHIEYEHRGAGSPVDEVKACYAFVRAALA